MLWDFGLITHFYLWWFVGKNYCYGHMEGEHCHCDYCKCKHGYGEHGKHGGCGGGHLYK